MSTELKIKKILTEKGYTSISFNEDENYLFELSRDLTGTDNEEFQGIFTLSNVKKEIKFNFGVYTTTLTFQSINIENNVQEIGNEIRCRISMVRKWVKECKSKALTEEYTINILDE